MDYRTVEASFDGFVINVEELFDNAQHTTIYKQLIETMKVKADKSDEQDIISDTKANVSGKVTIIDPIEEFTTIHGPAFQTDS